MCKVDEMNINWKVLVISGLIVIATAIGIVAWQVSAEETKDAVETTCENAYVPKDYAYMHGTRIEFMDEVSLNTMDVGHVSDMFMETFRLFRFSDNYDLVRHPKVVFSSQELHDCPRCIGIYGTWYARGYCNATIFLRNNMFDNPDYIWDAQKTLVVHEYAHHLHALLRYHEVEPACFGQLWNELVNLNVDFTAPLPYDIDFKNSYASTNKNEFFACAFESYAAQPTKFPNFNNGADGSPFTDNLYTWGQLDTFAKGKDIRTCVLEALTIAETVGVRIPPLP